MARSAYEDEGLLQAIIDGAFRRAETNGYALVTKADIEMEAQIQSAQGDVLEIIEILPPGRYARAALADQMNSAITAHGWAAHMGCVE